MNRGRWRPGDFDQDGDLDIAGASAAGELTIVENNERPPRTRGTFIRRVFNGGSKSRIDSMVLMEVNGDNDPDIAINSEDGVSFTPVRQGSISCRSRGCCPGPRELRIWHSETSTAMAPRTWRQPAGVLSCVTILKGQAAGTFALAAVAPVPRRT